MPRMPTFIRHPDDLHGLSLLPGRRSPGRGPIRLIGNEELDPETRLSFEKRLNRLYFACGCDKAALGLMLGLLSYAGWLATRAQGFESLAWRDLWIGLAVIVATSAIGKLIGRALADRDFRHAIEELKRVWKAPPRPEGPVSACG